VLAQALQHETDHLDGKLYLDRLDKESRREAMKQVRESDWF
jgi:peptide deformylase